MIVARVWPLHIYWKRSKMTEERRRESRKKEGNRVTIETVPQDRSATASAPQKKISFSLTEDISLKGIKVISETSFPIDTLMKIELSLAELYGPIQLQGRVKWIRSCGDDLFEVGIEFVGASPDQMRALVRHIYKYEEE